MDITRCPESTHPTFSLRSLTWGGKVKGLINDDPSCHHEYPPISGNAQFLQCARDLIFSSMPVNVASIQTLGGTGALHLGALLFSRANSYSGTATTKVWIPDPTWVNHHDIFDLMVGKYKKQLYPYYDPVTRGLDFRGMMAALETAEMGDVVLLHACCHNPTGIDPSKQQWIEIANLIQRRNLIPFIDAA